MPDRLPEKYYMRRRAAAAIAVVIVVLLLVWLISSLGGKSEDQPEAVASTAEATTQTETETSEAASSEAETSEAASSEAESEAPLTPEAKDTCAVEDLRIVARTNRPSYPAGEQPVFYLTVTNPTKADCEINLDEQPLRFEVYDLGTNQRVWSDIDCNPPVAGGKQVFKAGKERSFEAAWSRTQSAPNQCQERPEVNPGGYYLHTVIGPNPSQPVTFNLT